MEAVTAVMMAHIESNELAAMGCSALSNVLGPEVLEGGAEGEREFVGGGGGLTLAGGGAVDVGEQDG